MLSATSTSTTISNTPLMKTCPCCNGKGIQRSELDGMNHICPGCNGAGAIPQQIKPIPQPIIIQPEPNVSPFPYTIPKRPWRYY